MENKGNLKMKFFYWILLVPILVGIISCSPLNVQQGELEEWSSSTTEEAFDIKDSLDIENIFKKTGCQDFRTYVWNYVYRIVSLEGGKPPPYHTTREKIREKMQILTANLPAREENIEKFIELFIQVYASITEFMDQIENKEDASKILVQFEYGVIDSEHAGFINKLQDTFEALDKIAKTLSVACEESSTKELTSTKYSSQTSRWNVDWFHNMKQSVHPTVYGARKVMSTAYQSCSVLDLPLMKESQPTRGISVISKHPSGYGYRRSVSNLSALNSTHFYLRKSTVPNYSQCLDVSQHPLIYDFGGKPSTASKSINLFRNAGSGSTALGVDCSGFVTSAMASAGLRLKPGVFIRPVHVKGINSWMLKTAEQNKLSCLRKQDISVHNPIKSGDIIAANSHVVIVEYVGKDPLGLQSIMSESECHSKRINMANFHFTIIQSSAHNNGVGINRMHIQDANKMLSSFKRGLKRVASRACYKMFGKETHSNINEISVLRHASKNSLCRDREIYLEGQECLQSCSPSESNF